MRSPYLGCYRLRGEDFPREILFFVRLLVQVKEQV